MRSSRTESTSTRHCPAVSTLTAPATLYGLPVGASAVRRVVTFRTTPERSVGPHDPSARFAGGADGEQLVRECGEPGQVVLDLLQRPLVLGNGAGSSQSELDPAGEPGEGGA